MIKLLQKGKPITITCVDMDEKGMHISVSTDGFIFEEKFIKPEQLYSKLSSMCDKLDIHIKQHIPPQ